MLSLANNHIYDYGDVGLTETINEINRNGLEYIGADKSFEQAYKSRITNVNGIKIGFLSACESEFGCLVEDQDRGGYPWINSFLVDDIVRNLKNCCDIIVLIAHAGVEEIEIPLPEWRLRYRRLCDIGVNVVIGHHPHVPQGFEKYGNSLIFYSLGNFYFDAGLCSDKTVDSYSVSLNIDENRKILYEIIYHKQTKTQTILSSKEAVNFSLDKLNSLLERNYQASINKISIDLFYERYLPYYKSALNCLSVNASLKQKVKYIIKYFLCTETINANNMLLLLHNIRIDSHRFIVQRALSLMFEKVSE
jgi:poly-gamma-glutamate synthesis protein (capsule biosynthesis protein)